MTFNRPSPDEDNSDDPDWAKGVRATLEHDGDPLYDSLRSSSGLVRDDDSG